MFGSDGSISGNWKEKGRIHSFGQGLERQIVCRKCKKLFALLLSKIIRFKMRSGITGKCVLGNMVKRDFGDL